MSAARGRAHAPASRAPSPLPPDDNYDDGNIAAALDDERHAKAQVRAQDQPTACKPAHVSSTLAAPASDGADIADEADITLPQDILHHGEPPIDDDGGDIGLHGSPPPSTSRPASATSAAPALAEPPLLPREPKREPKCQSDSPSESDSHTDRPDAVESEPQVRALKTPAAQGLNEEIRDHSLSPVPTPSPLSAPAPVSAVKDQLSAHPSSAASRSSQDAESGHADEKRAPTERTKSIAPSAPISMPLPADIDTKGGEIALSGSAERTALPTTPRSSSDKPELPQGRAAVVLPPSPSPDAKGKGKTKDNDKLQSPSKKSRAKLAKQNEAKEQERNPLEIAEQDLQRVKARLERGWGRRASQSQEEQNVDVMEDGDDGWQEMPVMRTINEEMEAYNVLDEEDRKRLHFRVPSPDRVAAAAAELTPVLPDPKGKHARKGSKVQRRSLLGAGNATGQTLDVHDARGYEWRARPDTGSEGSGDEDDDAQMDVTGPGRGYTQVHLDEDEEAEQLYAATEYLFTNVDHNPFSEKPAVDAASQMDTAKGFLSEAQRIAYVGLCALLARQVSERPILVPPPPIGSKKPPPPDLGKPNRALATANASGNAWITDVLAKLYLHMDIAAPEQAMIAQLGKHGVLPSDLAPTLVTTQTIDNPDFDPEALADRELEEHAEHEVQALSQAVDGARSTSPNIEDENEVTHADVPAPMPSSRSSEDKARIEKPALLDPNSAAQGNIGELRGHTEWAVRHTHKNMMPLPVHGAPNEGGTDAAGTGNPSVVADDGDTATLVPGPTTLAGVSKEVTAADKTITLDLRWTVLCDLFLLVTFDADYDARSRTLLEQVAAALGLSALDVTKFETRIAETLEIDDGAARHLRLRDRQAIQKRAAAAKRRRILMMGLATIGGGVVLGLSAGLLAPFIGAGLGAAFGTIGIGGTSAFFGGAGGAAVITTTATLAGGSMAGTGMNRRTRAVKVFEFKPVHSNNRFRCILAIPGFMNGTEDDPRLPFSTVDSMMGDLFSVLWEPDLMREMGAAMSILWNETVSAGIQQLLAATVAGSLIGALAWPLWLSKLSYLIDNPWSNSLDRAKAAGLILADVILRRQMGSRPLTLVAFSLGARVIFYALRELYRVGGFGLVQDVYLVGAPVTASDKVWCQVRSVVAGRFVNGYSKTDWILGYLHRATSGGLASVAGLHPITGAPGVDNVDLTQIVPGHLAYRALMPLVLGELGFRTTADYFDEPEDLSKIPEREVRPMTEEELRGTMHELSYASGGDEAKIATAIASAQAAKAPPPAPTPKKNVFASLFRRKKVAEPASPSAASVASGSGGAGGNKATKAAATGTPDYDYDYDEDVDEVREDDAPLDVDEKQTPTSSRTSLEHTVNGSSVTLTSNARFDPDAILAELRGAGIEVKELPSSMPMLQVQASPAGASTSPLKAAPTSDASPGSAGPGLVRGTFTESNMSSVWGDQDLAAPASAYGSSTRLPAMLTSVRRESQPQTTVGLASGTSGGWGGSSSTHLPTLGFGSLSSPQPLVGESDGAPAPLASASTGLSSAKPLTIDVANAAATSPVSAWGAPPLPTPLEGPSAAAAAAASASASASATVSSASATSPRSNFDLARPPATPSLSFGAADGEITLQDEENPWG